jgi:hypothetical protein
MGEKPQNKHSETEKPGITLPATVEKIIPPLHPAGSEKAQIAVEGGEELYREIRVDNTLLDQNGNAVSLKPGAHVEVKIEAEPEETTPKKPADHPHAGASNT